LVVGNQLGDLIHWKIEKLLRADHLTAASITIITITIITIVFIIILLN